ncbi:DUF3089 domain-containing protein [Brevundimonas sp. S30B]|uniref:DUF3089 domain-containing protein n=1 Tax=unclassified Brevundimonas TaxID=2622653 RepID=UPI0010717CD1|nr:MULTISPECIES: DUF3089 domain-containing protein [unclassified Brevundimonas]QBX37896.1 DUF3089 domain-containing protein [Brevundimonas sp. MF30-B]TFW02749.1 DUF3089 domain-containing protein [Brevundimonas sp. S30B]
MRGPKLTFRQWVGYAGFALVFLLVAAVAVWRGDIVRAGLDPQVPFQTYDPPPAPDYARDDAWALNEAMTPDSGPASVFFVHSTTYDGGAEWNGPIGDPKADDYLIRVVLPNYAAPFTRAGAISAPRYRQGSVYTRLTIRDDAREARAFAYQDIVAAFQAWTARHPEGPIVLAGLEQGAELVDKLLFDKALADPNIRRRLAAVYLMDTLTPTSRFDSFPLCDRRAQFGCVVAWGAVAADDEAEANRRERRALTWDAGGRLVSVGRHPTACVNPITGSSREPLAPARASRGATNATNLEWGARPPLQARVVEAACEDGMLRYRHPASESFRRIGAWADRRKAPPFNLFYADVEGDVVERVAAWQAANAQQSQ